MMTREYFAVRYVHDSEMSRYYTEVVETTEYKVEETEYFPYEKGQAHVARKKAFDWCSKVMADYKADGHHIECHVNGVQVL